METWSVTETKHGKIRTTYLNTWVFATSNNIEKIISPLQSRLFVVNLVPTHISNSMIFLYGFFNHTQPMKILPKLQHSMYGIVPEMFDRNSC
jgi:hypothetical protein